ncbi:MAG: sulfatase-like hydrolase/transferase [Verrucomicrobiae bacterium]|nr:sulfatase-like hydrolase/transferase [Verrucomicrobiae bacterium]
MAAEGCRYERAFAVAGVCAPSRSAIINGMYPTFIAAHHMRTTHRNAATPELPTPYEVCRPHYVKCFTEYLRAAGYYCCNNFKTDYQFTAPHGLGRLQSAGALAESGTWATVFCRVQLHTDT